VLLCSLLLGFGLDAYVCVGTKLRGASHTWVVTISTDGRATFWESLTGDRLLLFFMHQLLITDNSVLANSLNIVWNFKKIKISKSAYIWKIQAALRSCEFNW